MVESEGEPTVLDNFGHQLGFRTTLIISKFLSERYIFAHSLVAKPNQVTGEHYSSVSIT